jgi:hypothetical protein
VADELILLMSVGHVTRPTNLSGYGNCPYPSCGLLVFQSLHTATRERAINRVTHHPATAACRTVPEPSVAQLWLPDRLTSAAPLPDSSHPTSPPSPLILPPRLRLWPPDSGLLTLVPRLRLRPPNSGPQLCPPQL